MVELGMLYLVFSKKQQIENMVVVEADDREDAKAKAKLLLPISGDGGATFGVVAMKDMADGWVLYAES